MAARRKSDQRPDDLCGGVLHKRARYCVSMETRGWIWRSPWSSLLSTKLIGAFSPCRVLGLKRHCLSAFSAASSKILLPVLLRTWIEPTSPFLVTTSLNRDHRRRHTDQIDCQRELCRIIRHLGSGILSILIAARSYHFRGCCGEQKRQNRARTKRPATAGSIGLYIIWLIAAVMLFRELRSVISGK
jgi:hypothetical protein